ncbi:MAG: tape measure protein, partial [Gemmatimonadota bacterium]
MATERSVTVRLRAVVDDFKRSFGEAAAATQKVGAEAQAAEQKTSRLGQAGRAIGRTALTGLGAATTALVGLGAAAANTGVEYNSLEQQSRAALTTLLGSTEAASRQMDQLREFVRTSPFPREVFIRAQQQLIAFGMEAERVIPTLDAVQDAIAATGGTSREIEDVVRVLAQVQSTGKITAQELRELGNRGIDAAQLLGDAMGKTAGQIREDITAGTLDADTALRTLVDQMEVRFGGAAENVRQTWFGAVDSLRGAFRDVGSVIAAPFVDPQGGGAAVDWARG